MADILPYLGVSRDATQDLPENSTYVMEDYTGWTANAAEKALKAQTLTAKCIGTGETVTSQIPAAGQSVPGGSQVLLYFGEAAPEDTVRVPDFTGMNRQQASNTATELGLYLLITGNREVSHNVTVTAQSAQPGSRVPFGSTITLEFTDQTARD